MIHIGTVRLNGREYSLDLTPPNQARNDAKIEPSGAVARRNLPTARSEIFLLNTRKTVGAQNVGRPTASMRPIEDLRRVAQFTRREHGQALAGQAKSKLDRDRAVKLVSRFLSWCFPVREFNSPLQRLLYLSMEGPKTRYRRRSLLP
jgi:hypothetical protein